MIEELYATAKQTALELISLSDTVADNMQTWGDILDKNPDSETAKVCAGFINSDSAPADFEMVIDVQTPPNGGAVARTWAIRTHTDNDGKEYFNNIQLTFMVDDQRAHDLVAKGKAITREDIRTLLQDSSSELAAITVSNNSGGDGAGQTYGERYDTSAGELEQDADMAAKVNQALQTVLQTLKQSAAN